MSEFASVPLLTVRSTFHLMSIFVLRFIEPFQTAICVHVEINGFKFKLHKLCERNFSNLDKYILTH